MDKKLIQKLRDVTGLGFLQCNDLLKKSNGNFDSAIKNAESLIDRRIGKIQDRESSSFKVFSYIHVGSKKGGMIQVGSETDFVSNTEEFMRFGNDLAMHIVAMDPVDVPSLLDQPFVKDNSLSIADMVKNLQSKVGEKIEVKNFSVFS